MTDDTFLSHLTVVEELLWVVPLPTGMPQYDFTFEQYFACRHPVYREGRVKAIARMGAAADYQKRFDAMAVEGIDLVHTPSDYNLTSHLPLWYPLLSDITPRSQWYDRRPTVDEVGSAFNWPVFAKGERQTSRHQKSLSIIDGPGQFDRVMDLWESDPILHWQQTVIREFVPLRLVGAQAQNTLPRAFEFRTFWWKDQCVGFGPYWVGEHYTCTDEERSAAIAVAGEAARRMGVTFLVVDVAQTATGRWIVIEVNDGQDSGYAGVQPLFMWRNVLDQLRG